MQDVSRRTDLLQLVKFTHAIPLSLIIGACIISALMIAAFWVLHFSLWLIGILVIVAWMPLVLSKTADIYHYHKWLALLFVLMVSQSAHFIEHSIQIIQIHLLGLKGPMAGGVISVLNTEWVHFLWNAWVLMLGGMLLWNMRKNKWMLMLFLFAIWHQFEHTYLIVMYIQTGLEGNPGLIARGGWIGGGLPLSRPDVHFWYAVLEEALLLLAYFDEWKRFAMTRPDQKQLVRQPFFARLRQVGG